MKLGPTGRHTLWFDESEIERALEEELRGNYPLAGLADLVMHYHLGAVEREAFLRAGPEKVAELFEAVREGEGPGFHRLKGTTAPGGETLYALVIAGRIDEALDVVRANA